LLRAASATSSTCSPFTALTKSGGRGHLLHLNQAAHSSHRGRGSEAGMAKSHSNVAVSARFMGCSGGRIRKGVVTRSVAHADSDLMIDVVARGEKPSTSGWCESGETDGVAERFGTSFLPLWLRGPRVSPCRTAYWIAGWDQRCRASLSHATAYQCSA
jgi:hypothetical protein